MFHLLMKRRKTFGFGFGPERWKQVLGLVYLLLISIKLTIIRKRDLICFVNICAVLCHKDEDDSEDHAGGGGGENCNIFSGMCLAWGCVWGLDCQEQEDPAREIKRLLFTQLRFPPVSSKYVGEETQNTLLTFRIARFFFIFGQHCIINFLRSRVEG